MNQDCTLILSLDIHDLGHNPGLNSMGVLHVCIPLGR